MSGATSRLQPRFRLRLRQRPERAATLALVAVTAAWGSTFVVVQDAVERMPVLDFLAVRFAVAALVLVAVRPRSVLALPAGGLQRAGLLGIVLGAGYVGQTFGLQHTSAAVSGFLTGTFVVFTPLVAALALGRRVDRWTWAAVGVASTGLALISLRGLAIGLGEALTLLCALCFAVHIVGLGEWSARYDATGLAVVQLGTVALLCATAGLPGGLSAPPDAGVWVAVGVTAVFASSFAFLAQTWAQARLPAARVAVILTLEPVFAGVFAVLAGERLGPRTLLGGALVLAAMYLVELAPGTSRGAPELGRVGRLEA